MPERRIRTPLVKQIERAHGFGYYRPEDNLGKQKVDIDRKDNNFVDDKQKLVDKRIGLIAQIAGCSEEDASMLPLEEKLEILRHALSNPQTRIE